MAADNPDAADRVEQEIRAAFLGLARNPGIGHTRHDLTAENWLFFSVRSLYQIVYDPNTQPLTILRVIRGGLDVANEL